MAALQTQPVLALGAAGIGIGIAIGIALFLVRVLYNSLILWVTTKLFKLHNTKYKTAVLAAIVAGAINLAAGIILNLVIALKPATAAATGGATLAAGLLNLALGWAAMFIANSLTAKMFYKLETGKSFLIGLVWTASAIIIGFIIGLILAAILVAVMVATVKPVM